jgi:2-amino-4-hydroxy-6-hydroxymethyldihydropteridine diphosphokinase
VNYVIALGSNLGDRVGYLKLACQELEALAAISSIYETLPVGGPEGQGPYLNMVVIYESDRSPRKVLEECQRIEGVARRCRNEYHGPRTLDLDIVAVDTLVVEEPDLVIPHPRAKDRGFVMAPIYEVDPALAWRLSPEIAALLEHQLWQEGREIITGVWLKGQLDL